MTQLAFQEVHWPLDAGVNDRLFKSHERWRSESAKDGYVDEDIDALLTVSSMLGL